MLSTRETSTMTRRKIRVDTLVLLLTFLALLDVRIHSVSSANGTHETSTTTAAKPEKSKGIWSTELADETKNSTAEVDKSENPWDHHFALLHPDSMTRCAAYPSTLCTDRCPKDPLTASGPQAVERGAIHHEALVRSAQSASSDLDVVIMGDSITENLNGTRLQGAFQLPEPYREIFRSFFTKEGGGTLAGLALGGGGDTSQNLLWHLQNGMLPDSLRPKIWMILVGTNDLGKNRCSPEYVVAGILSVVKYIQTQRPGTPILLHGILPRGESKKVAQLGLRWESIQIINGHLRTFCENHPNVYFMDSGDMFLSHDGTKVDKRLMDDALHPTLEGMRQWVPLIVEQIHRIIG